MKTVYSYLGNIGSGKAYCMLQKLELLKTTGNTIYLISFADPLKQFLQCAYGLTKEGLDESFRKNSITKTYVKHQYIDNMFAHLRRLNHEEHKKMSAYDLKVCISDNYEKYEQEFYTYIIHAHGGMTADSKNDDWSYSHCYRRLIQMYGTELARFHDPFIWANLVIQKIENVFKQNLADYAFIDDMRFFTERDALYDFKNNSPYDVKIIGVVATPEVRAKRRGITVELILQQEQHQSESEVNDIIATLPPENVINNNGE
jgi:hypothetical protein